ncbi:MAG: hypothetical protein CMH83_19125 [Nocardioides sp.]|nr:hypothetical protein [Nocardioides sp.]
MMLFFLLQKGLITTCGLDLQVSLLQQEQLLLIQQVLIQYKFLTSRLELQVIVKVLHLMLL